MIWPEKEFYMGRAIQDTGDLANGPSHLSMVPHNNVPFATSGSMKYALSLFLLYVINPLRGIQYR
jgi:hypothetical protein